MTKKITRREVAAEAGVSETTVSVVISGNANIKIAEETQKRVLDAAKKSGYVPHYAARSMASGKSSVLGVISPWGAETWFFAQTLDGISESAEKYGYATLLCGKGEEGAKKASEIFVKAELTGYIFIALYRDYVGAVTN